MRFGYACVTALLVLGWAKSGADAWHRHRVRIGVPVAVPGAYFPGAYVPGAYAPGAYFGGLSGYPAAYPGCMGGVPSGYVGQMSFGPAATYGGGCHGSPYASPDAYFGGMGPQFAGFNWMTLMFEMLRRSPVTPPPDTRVPSDLDARLRKVESDLVAVTNTTMANKTTLERLESSSFALQKDLHRELRDSSAKLEARIASLESQFNRDLQGLESNLTSRIDELEKRLKAGEAKKAK